MTAKESDENLKTSCHDYVCNLTFNNTNEYI